MLEGVLNFRYRVIYHFDIFCHHDRGLRRVSLKPARENDLLYEHVVSLLSENFGRPDTPDILSVALRLLDTFTVLRIDRS